MPHSQRVTRRMIMGTRYLFGPLPPPIPNPPPRTWRLRRPAGTALRACSGSTQRGARPCAARSPDAQRCQRSTDPPTPATAPRPRVRSALPHPVGRSARTSRGAAQPCARNRERARAPSCQSAEGVKQLDRVGERGALATAGQRQCLIVRAPPIGARSQRLPASDPAPPARTAVRARRPQPRGHHRQPGGDGAAVPRAIAESLDQQPGRRRGSGGRSRCRRQSTPISHPEAAAGETRCSS